jgi:hypothetical protein
MNNLSQHIPEAESYLGDLISTNNLTANLRETGKKQIIHAGTVSSYTLNPTLPQPNCPNNPPYCLCCVQAPYKHDC